MLWSTSLLVWWLLWFWLTDSGKMSLFATNVTVSIFCWTFDSWISWISTKVTFFGLPWFIWLMLISFTRGCIYKWRWWWIRFSQFFWAISSARVWLNIICISVDVFSSKRCLIVFESSPDINESRIHSSG